MELVHEIFEAEISHGFPLLLAVRELGKPVV